MSSSELRRQPRQARARARVGKILEAAADVLRERGYAGMTTNHVAERAGVPIGSIYQYFGNKDALVLALLERRSEAELSVLGQHLDRFQQGAPVENVVRELIEAIVEIERSDPELRQVISDEIPRRLSAGLRARTDRKARTLIASFLGAAGVPAERIDVAAFVILAAVESVVHEAVLSDGAIGDDEAVVSEVTHLVLGYLNAVPG